MDLVAGDFNGAAWRRPYGNDRRLTNINEEAFADTNLPVPPGATPRHKQFGTVLMKVRTAEQIADDCACWCRTFRGLVFGRPEETLTTLWT